jgi:nitroimidazol reductase NimA-like FMN-containing flavoprotein (pyridoxamine 5'-phosphate oxidase superfamily)
MTHDHLQTERTTVRRLPERGVYDRPTIYRILDAGLLCHVGLVSEGRPVVVPMVYGRVGDCVCLHGSKASRLLRTLAAGAEACVTVTLIDGLVLARSIFHHSMNYRSVVVFGTGECIEDPAEKMKLLRSMSEHLIAGRWKDVRLPNESEFKQTLVIAIPIREASAKIRDGPPRDEEEDYALPIWAGVLPLQCVPGEPVADIRMAPGIELPECIRDYRVPLG